MNRSVHTLAIALLAAELIAGCGGTTSVGSVSVASTGVNGVPQSGRPQEPNANQPAVATDSWASAANMAVGLTGHSAVSLSNGKTLVTGGTTILSDGSPSILASAQIYDPAANTWSSTASMANARNRAVAVVIPNGNVLVIGGIGQPSPISPILSSAELYNPTTGHWSSAGTMGSTRVGHTATVLANGKVLITGGAVDDLGPNVLITGILTSAEIYDPATNAWSPASSMSNPRYQHTATLLPNGKVLVAGGSTDLSADTLASAEIYDPAADTWSPAGSMNAARAGHAAALLPNGTVLVAGGGMASAEVFDPLSNSWALTESMTDSRSEFAAVRLTDGTILVAGGSKAARSELSSAEIFNSSTGAWTPTLSLVTDRSNLTLTLLPDGSVLAAGGANQSGFLSSCERYEK